MFRLFITRPTPPGPSKNFKEKRIKEKSSCRQPPREDRTTEALPNKRISLAVFHECPEARTAMANDSGARVQLVKRVVAALLQFPRWKRIVEAARRQPPCSMRKPALISRNEL